jgi:hypothetical protein
MGQIISQIALASVLRNKFFANAGKQWTNGRKWFNYGIICFYALMIFAMYVKK